MMNGWLVGFRQAEFDIEFGKGISKAGEIVDIGLKENILQKSGTWYTTADGKQLGQGREKAKAFLGMWIWPGLL